MPQPADRRRRTARGLAAGLALLCAGVLLQTPGLPAAAAEGVSGGAGLDAAVATDPEVAAARAALDRAEADLNALSAALDEAAGAYERAHAHALRLQEEVGEADRTIAARRRQTERAVDEFTNHAVSSYKRPAAGVELAQAVLAADGPGTAMHRVALLQQLNVRGAQRVAELEEVGERTADVVQQQHVVLAGSAGAAADADRTGKALAELIEDARARAEHTREEVAAAEDDARERMTAEARQAAEDAAAATMAGAGAAGFAGTWTPGSVSLIGPGAGSVAAAWMGAAGPVYCPVAGPAGFIDSWGFPRSGGRSHQGADMFAAYGTPLVAPTDGTVRRVYNNALGGLSVDFVTASGDRFYYAHLSAATVVAGQPLAAGQVLGAVGDSGNARGTPPHLHWQFHPGDGAPVNPYALAAALCR